MNMKHISAICAAAACLLMAGCSDNGTLKPNAKPAIPQDKEIEAKIKKHLAEMTVEEKAGQMVQITVGTVLDFQNRCVDMQKLTEMVRTYKIGSFLNVPFDQAQTRELTAQIVSDIQKVSMEELGIPTIYGLDQIHGASYIVGATFFPQEVNLGASFNPAFAAAMGEAIGYETRAAMVPWVFSPVMDLTRNAAWPRNWESWGEDPYLQTVMASTEVRAIQGSDPNNIDLNHCGVSIKHYMGYGAPVTGKDRTPAIITYSDLKEKFFPPFKACIEEGAVNVMVNSASINGVPTHANKTLLTGWLKEGLNWDGMIITDWADVNNLYTRDHLAADKKDALCMGINAGIDMVMETYDPSAAALIVELVREGKISKGRLDDAVARILRLKYRLGLFENPTWDISEYSDFASERFVDQAYAAAVESEVLLKNEGGILPLKQGTRILVTGPCGNSMRSLNGGWSYTWQGTADPSYSSQYNTIYEAMAGKFGASNVKYVAGVEFDETGDWQKDEYKNKFEAFAAAVWADVIVACIGENSYCETPGNINDITLSENQLSYVEELAKFGKPIVLVLNEGRARVISRIEPLAKAVVDVMLPGNYGGDALAALLSGEENFSGKLPFTYPKYANSLHTYDYKVSENVSTMEGMYNYDAVMDVQWPFGAGLSYTKFTYGDLKVDRSEFAWNDVLTFSIDITNTGSVAGKETALLYSSDIIASMMPDVKRLRAFTKVSLAPGETTTVTLQVPASDLAFVDADGRWTLEEGDFRFSLAGKSLTARCTGTKVWNTFNK